MNNQDQYTSKTYLLRVWREHKKMPYRFTLIDTKSEKDCHFVSSEQFTQHITIHFGI